MSDFTITIINLLLTATLYMFYPVFTVFRKKGKHTYTRKELRNTAVINSVIIQIVVVFLTYPTVPTFMPPLFYGYINYRLLKKYLLQNDHEAVSDVPSEPDPQPVPEALPEQPVQPERVKVKAVRVKPAGKPAQPPRSDLQPAPKPEHPARPPDTHSELRKDIDTGLNTNSVQNGQPDDTAKGFAWVCLILLLFLVLLAIFGSGSPESSQSDLQNDYFITTASGTSYTKEEVLSLFTEYEIPLMYHSGSSMRHLYTGCELLKSSNEKVFTVPFGFRNSTNPPLTVECPFCFTNDRIENYLRHIEIQEKIK